MEKKRSCVDLLLSRPIVFVVTPNLTARYPTSDCFAVFDPSELPAKAGLGHIRLFLLSHHKLRYMLQLLLHRYTDILSRTTILEKTF